VPQEFLGILAGKKGAGTSSDTVFNNEITHKWLKSVEKRGKISNFHFIISNLIPTFAVQNFRTMARVCQVTGKKPITGNKVSHSNIKTKRRFLPNLQTKRYFLAEEDKWVILKVSSEAIRTINKNGLFSVVKQLRAAGEKI
jgi:large subunit ribosomal protein L28